jgi:hypothetical protein
MNGMAVQNSQTEMSWLRPTFPEYPFEHVWYRPFGTCSACKSFGYTDTSSLPRGHEQAAILCIPNRRIENGVIESASLEGRDLD